MGERLHGLQREAEAGDGTREGSVPRVEGGDGGAVTRDGGAVTRDGGVPRGVQGGVPSAVCSKADDLGTTSIEFTIRNPMTTPHAGGSTGSAFESFLEDELIANDLRERCVHSPFFPTCSLSVVMVLGKV